MSAIESAFVNSVISGERDVLVSGAAACAPQGITARRTYGWRMWTRTSAVRDTSEYVSANSHHLHAKHIV
jgi:hypothetical protein